MGEIVNCNISLTCVVEMLGMIPFTLLLNAIKFSCNCIDGIITFSSAIACIKPWVFSYGMIKVDITNCISPQRAITSLKVDLIFVNPCRFYFRFYLYFVLFFAWILVILNVTLIINILYSNSDLNKMSTGRYQRSSALISPLWYYLTTVDVKITSAQLH